MGNKGLIDPRSGFSLACCFSGPVQCPATAPVAYKIKNYCSYSIYTMVQQDSLTARMPKQGGRLPVRARFRSPPAASAGACSRCRRRPANADGSCRSVQPEARVKARRRRPKQSKTLKLKSEILPEIESKPKVLDEDQIKRGSTKRESTEARVEAGSSHRSRNLGFNAATVECKCQEHNSISKELSRGSYHTKGIFEYIFE